ncbi:MAG: NfeD family protein [Clostridia bacterium]|nr:NfeD family protein [Clostridia bacterium]
MNGFAEFFDMTFFWLIMLFVFVIIEALTVHIVSIWFALGSLCSVIASALGAQIWIQAIIFIVVSAAAIILTRPLVKKFILPKKTPTNFEQIIGQTAVVSESISNTEAAGAVKINGMEWTARSEDGNPIAEGCEVTVIRIEGVKAIVTAK